MDIGTRPCHVAILTPLFVICIRAQATSSLRNLAVLGDAHTYLGNNLSYCRYIYESAFPVGRLVRQVADKHQVSTQRSWKRPFGVGLLVGGYDVSGPHLYNTCPSGNYYEYKAMAIGARAQVGSDNTTIRR